MNNLSSFGAFSTMNKRKSNSLLSLVVHRKTRVSRCDWTHSIGPVSCQNLRLRLLVVSREDSTISIPKLGKHLRKLGSILTWLHSLKCSCKANIWTLDTLVHALAFVPACGNYAVIDQAFAFYSIRLFRVTDWCIVFKVHRTYFRPSILDDATGYHVKVFIT